MVVLTGLSYQFANASVWKWVSLCANNLVCLSVTVCVHVDKVCACVCVCLCVFREKRWGWGADCGKYLKY